MYRLEIFDLITQEVTLKQWFDSFSEAKDFAENNRYFSWHPYRIIDESSEFIQEVEA